MTAGGNGTTARCVRCAVSCQPRCAADTSVVYWSYPQMKKLLLGTVGALALCTAPADAARYNGWYVSLEGGANKAEDWNARSNITNLGVVTTTAPAHASFDTGWAVLGSVGYAFHNWRLEVEGGYRHNNTDRL